MTLEKAIPNFDEISEEFERAFGAQAVDGLEHDAEDPMDVTDPWNEHRIRSGLKVGPRRNGSPVLTMTASGVGQSEEATGTPSKSKPARTVDITDEFAERYRSTSRGTASSPDHMMRTAVSTPSAGDSVDSFAEKYRAANVTSSAHSEDDEG